MKMSKFFYLTVIFLSSGSVFAAEYSCRANYRKFSTEEVFEQKQIDLEKVDETAAYVKYEGELSGYAVLGNISKTDNTVLLSVVKAPNYREGSVSKTSLLSGMASASVIAEENGSGVYTLHKVECYYR